MGARPRDTAESAAAVLRAGGIVAHPTEAVWGLACDPASEAATRRLLALRRPARDKGLILVAASASQLDRLVDWSGLPDDRRQAVLASWPGPHTWIVPATAAVPAWIRGSHAGVAVRITAHPPAAALCTAFGGAIASTSANTAGAPPPRALPGGVLRRGQSSRRGPGRLAEAGRRAAWQLRPPHDRGQDDPRDVRNPPAADAPRRAGGLRPRRCGGRDHPVPLDGRGWARGH